MPESGAKATRYDPLKLDLAVEDRRDRNANRIYSRLIQTVTHRIDPYPEQGNEPDGGIETEQFAWHPITVTAQPSDDITRRILDFSADFGLLGLLHRRFARIVGPVVQLPGGARQRWYCERAAHNDDLSPSQWGRSLIHSGATDRAPLVDRYGFCIGAPHGASDAVFEAVNDTYFGGELPEAIPQPDSDDAFRIYGEPIADWIETAVELATAIRQHDQQYLNTLLRVAWVDRTIGAEMATAEFRVGSLLEAAALQFFDDMSGGFRLRYCQNRSCTRRLYYDNDPRSRFCSQRCASAERQREYREAKRMEFEAGMKRRKR